MKKLTALLLVLALAVGLCACGSSDESTESKAATSSSGVSADTNTGEKVDASDSTVKFGMVLVGDENEGYTYAHIEGVREAAKAIGLSEDNILWKYSIPEDSTCYDAIVDLIGQGCTCIVTNSYGHQSYAQQAAADFPDVTVVSMTGDTANWAGVANFHNAFTSVYESRFVSGVVAGMKVKELVDNGKLSDKNYDKDGNVKIGYVGAYPYAEVVSGYTAFFLGIKSVYENVSMEVQYTNSWFDITAEGTAAEALVADGCVIIGQHADSTGAPAALQALYEEGTVCYSVGYNVDMLSVAPDVALTSATNVWEVYYEYLLSSVISGKEVAQNWAAGYSVGAVAITKLGNSVAEGTADKVAEVEAALKDGSLHVFATDTFTVNGANLDTYLVDMDGDWVGDTEAIWDGYFHESELRSAPSFDIRIDGITELN